MLRKIIFNTLNLAVKNLTLWQFIIANLLLIGMLFLISQFKFLYWQVIFFAFLFLPLLSFILAINNQKYSHKWLKHLSASLWTIGLFIFINIKNQGEIDLSSVLFTLAFFAFFFFIQHFLILYTQNSKPTNTLLFVILMAVATLMDFFSNIGLLGAILTPIITIGLVIWTARLILTKQFILRHCINMIVGTLFVIGSEFNANYQNTKSQTDGQALAKEITEYHKIHQTYPNKESLIINNPKVRYHHWHSEPDKKSHAMLYYSDFKMPYCRYFYDFEKQAWSEDCKD
ncbi:hypothetical protein AAHK14_09935 [Moraxella sp. K1664]|uniref:Uncharacterized protein n=3 Tax=Moraxellaceae TaxID=468 RepID=A0A1B8Q2U1_MORLA|nr:hypothetical protein [Moraxella lacunata]MDI4484075.1 hypothetical protein [Moraxella lacunata]MDI4508537.1 hypothetical protein [Moraxella lacunata]OBX63280.1 hypothetical protein A9309_05925 [Moraxella lacunata]OBX65294.1 hypothetical protein A9Z63_12745 [Moraxella lacunata]